MSDYILPILISVAVVAGIGLIIGLVLSVASIVMAVPKDEKEEKILNILPGANCGACGFSGCSGYASALSKGEAKVGLCPVGGEKCAKDAALILGVDAGSVEKKVAFVQCRGNCDNTSNKAIYDGIQSCSAASKIGNGVSECIYGCLGLGDCVDACQYGAVSICNGVSVIDSQKCTACSACVKTCPRHIISLVPYKTSAVVTCSNKDKGANTRKVCKVGCIGCKKCEKLCEADAIKVNNFCAYVDMNKCVSCMKCIEGCPQGCITHFVAE